MTNDGTWTYSWEHGRQLASMTDGTTTWTYTYNSDGLRTKRTTGSTTYNYVYTGSQLAQMTVGSSTLNFTYDASGSAMAVTYNGTTYYYVTNLQGDVVALLDSSGVSVVSYTYDAWGKIRSTTGTLATTLGADNPLRYRGYVYDQETGLYYLQSRYYDPEMGRFINADIYTSTGQGLLGNNMFAYCNNMPVMLFDPFGRNPLAYAAIGGAVAGAVLNLTFYLHGAGDNASFGEALLAMTFGAIGGALGGAAGVATGDVKFACVIGAGIVTGLYSEVTGGSFWVSGIWGTLAAYGGTMLDTLMFSGFELATANYLTSTYIGFFAEMLSQASHGVIPERLYNHTLVSNSLANISSSTIFPTGSSHVNRSSVYVTYN